MNYAICGGCNACAIGGKRPSFCPVSQRGPLTELWRDKRKVDTNAIARQKYVGLSIMQRCGYTATVVEYINSQNATVKFDDPAGTIRTNIPIVNVKEGRVDITPRQYVDRYKGETRKQSNGLDATYLGKTARGYAFLWEDGTIETSWDRNYPQNWKKGVLCRKDLNIQNQYRNFHGFVVEKRKKIDGVVKFETSQGWLTAKEMIEKGA